MKSKCRQDTALLQLLSLNHVMIVKSFLITFKNSRFLSTAIVVIISSFGRVNGVKFLRAGRSLGDQNFTDKGAEAPEKRRICHSSCNELAEETRLESVLFVPAPYSSSWTTVTSSLQALPSSSSLWTEPAHLIKGDDALKPSCSSTGEKSLLKERKYHLLCVALSKPWFSNHNKIIKEGKE